MLTQLTDGDGQYDPYRWTNRTMHAAHLWVMEHFDEVSMGAVVDVEFILGETDARRKCPSGSSPIRGKLKVDLVVLLSADQQWHLAGVLARKAKTQPLIVRRRMMARAMMLATLAQRQWKRPHDSRTAKEPCPPSVLREMGLPTIAAALWSPNGPRPGA
jgi:hypothetical protein